MTSREQLDLLVNEIVSRKKYRDLDPGLVRSVGAQEISRHPNMKDAVHASLSRLHQSACSYQDRGTKYDAWVGEIEQIPPSLSAPQTKELLRQIMAYHASTRERIPILPDFYRGIFSHLREIHTILDCACGLHPLSIPWMPLGEPFTYDACDVFIDQAAFLNKYFDHFRIHGEARVCDLTRETPGGHYDFVFLLKTLPCLEQLEKGSAGRLLGTLRARHILISYPVTSLGGRDKGMLKNYTQQFETLAADWKGKVNRFEYSSELVFLLSRE